MRHWTILCDFDGTIADDDVTDVLLTRLAAPEWERIEADWQLGLIGSRECMTRQVALIDASRQTVDALLDTLTIDPDFPAFVFEARQQGMSVKVVSDGLDYAINRILARHGLSDLPVFANHVVHDGARGWSMSSPHAVVGCAAASGTCKCDIARRHFNTLLVGDGRSDFCVAGTADYVFAKHHLIGHCRWLGIPHQPITDFHQARSLLDRLPELAGADAVVC